MNTPTAPDQSNPLADRTAMSADRAIRSTRLAANSAMDSLESTVEDARLGAAPLLNRAGRQAEALAQRAQRGVDAVREGSRQLKTRAMKASECTVSYVRTEPVKAVLIAAMAGAAVMAVTGFVFRRAGAKAGAPEAASE